MVITYANPATIVLMQEHEATFQIKPPGFSAQVDNVIGTCIDVFHTTPTHQRKILSNPASLPWKIDIRIEYLSFELNVTAINDVSGDYIGNTLEWQDVTGLCQQENKTVQLQGAIDQSGTAQVLIDRDVIITYANPATFDLIQKYEVTIRIKYPVFSTAKDEVMGTCI